MKPPVPQTRFTEINQICVVVRDIRAAMRRYWETAGIGPWKLYTVGGTQLAEMTYRGEQAQFKFLMAHAQVGDIDFELIQPLEGETIYQEYLDRHGEGVQHLGMLVDDLDQAMAEAEANGVAVIQYGRARTGGRRGGFAYLDTEGPLHITLEFIQRDDGSAPVEPDEIYP